MGKLMDYLLWRGDLSFTQDPFNDIDALVLAMLSYLPFQGIVPGGESRKSLSLKEACHLYFAKDAKPAAESVDSLPPASEPAHTDKESLLARAAACARFEKVRLSTYAENTDFVVGRQFGALTFILNYPERQKVIAFRGTDKSFIGWKEDCQLAYLEQIPAQESARSYLERSIGIYSGEVIVCGHSKGGNLAIYAGLNISPVRQSKISKIINFDGPGFDFSVIDRASFSHAEDKVINYLPEESVVGMLLEPVGKRSVVSSSARAIGQHNALNWEIERNGFVNGKLSNTSTFIDQTIKTWLKELSLPERGTFIEALFDILGASEGALIKLNAQDSLKEINKILVKYANLDAETRNMLSQTFLSFTSQLTNQTKTTLSATLKEKLPKKN